MCGRLTNLVIHKCEHCTTDVRPFSITGHIPQVQTPPEEANMDVTVGVDVGGTNTDAVVLSAKGEVKGKAKVLTSTTDLTGSVCLAVTRALNSLPGKHLIWKTLRRNLLCA